VGLAEVPVIVLAHLAQAQRRALVIADNRFGMPQQLESARHYNFYLPSFQ
jgi:ParB-like chromosome segregation protein Spo0J